ncbi:hypothetical protein SK128_002314, partial [Halocaridina rubra]
MYLRSILSLKHILLYTTAPVVFIPVQYVIGWILMEIVDLSLDALPEVNRPTSSTCFLLKTTNDRT